MPAELDCQRCDGEGVAVLRVAGALTVATAPHLRIALLKCLADQPDAVAVDVAGLWTQDDVQLTVLLAAARHAAAWPGVPLIVCAPTPAFASALIRLGIDWYVQINRDVPEALARVHDRDMPPHVRQQFPPTADTVPAARRLVADACTRWRLDHLTADARLATSELVSNAVLHAATPIHLDVHQGLRHLHVAVRDFDPRPARPVGPDAETAPGGRGLLLVEAVATAWGCTPTADGKVTWASFGMRSGQVHGRSGDNEGSPSLGSMRR